jgi:sRNA-binding regulator protein Hfq
MNATRRPSCAYNQGQPSSANVRQRACATCISRLRFRSSNEADLSCPLSQPAVQQTAQAERIVIYPFWGVIRKNEQQLMRLLLPNLGSLTAVPQSRYFGVPEARWLAAAGHFERSRKLGTLALEPFHRRECAMGTHPNIPAVQHPRSRSFGHFGARTRLNSAALLPSQYTPLEESEESRVQRQAELFYLQKQIQSQTPMVIVLEDGERIEGTIEWYDRQSLKVRGRAKTLVYKSAIKYMYKLGDAGSSV